MRGVAPSRSPAEGSPREALALFAPDEAPAPEEAAQVVPVRQEQLKERLGDRFRALDTPLLVEWSDHRRSTIVFVMEVPHSRRLRPRLWPGPARLPWNNRFRSLPLSGCGYSTGGESDWSRFSPHRLAQYCLDLALMFRTERVVPVTSLIRALKPCLE